MNELNKIVTNFPMSLSQDENRNLALTLSAVLEGGGGGGVANAIWKPAVDQDGLMTWSWDTFPDSARPPEAVNIKGPRGESGAPGRDGTNGTNGTDGKDGVDGKTPQIQINSSNAHWEWRYSGASEWTDLGVVASGAVGPQGIPGASGAPGAKGEDGDDGVSPAVTLSAITDPQHPNGGTRVTITDKTHPTGQHFDIFNGNDGSGSSDKFDPSTMSGYGTEAAPYGVDTTVIATQAWVGQQGYLTSIPNTYALKTDVDAASAKALSQAKTWVNQQNFTTSAGLDANKQYAMTTAGWTDFVIPSTSGYLPLSGGTVSGATYFSAANGQNMLAVASAATLIGASRQTSEHFGQDNNALGTTWIGVGGAGMYRGFLKYTQGGNVGDLDSNNTIQVEFTPSNKGTIFAKAKNSGNDCPETQILNPTKASCDSMVQSANANLVSGPNYMLAKNADGQFVIGAACVNCTDINNVTLAPNTYYFVYEV